MPLFTIKPTDQLFERFMKHQPNYKTDSPEADGIQETLDAEKERKETRAMIYRDERHQHTFEKEAVMRPESISRALLAALYLLTADRNLWNQVRDHISLRRMYVEDMRPKNLTGTSYVYFAAAKDILSGSHTVQLTEIADPAILSMKSYLIRCTALAIRAYGVEKASRIQSSKESGRSLPAKAGGGYAAFIWTAAGQAGFATAFFQSAAAIFG